MKPRTLGDLARAARIFEETDGLGAALDDLVGGRPVVVRAAGRLQLLTPADAIGYSANRRLIDLPISPVDPLPPETLLPQALALCRHSEFVVTLSGSGAAAVASRAAILEALLGRVAATDVESAPAVATVLEVLEQSPEGIVVLDAARRVHAVNLAGRRTLELLSIPASGDPVLTIGGVCIDALAEDARQGMPRDLALSEPRRRVFSVRTLRTGDAGDQTLVLILRDVTHLRHRQAREADQERMAVLGQLSAGIVHDLNNLLTVIMGEVSLMEGRSEDRPALDAVQDAASRSAGLLRQILSFAKRELADPVPLHLGSVLRDIEGLLGRLAGPLVSLQIEVTEPVDPILADPVQIERILANLVTNAACAMPSGGSLTITLANDPSCSVLTGTDARGPRPAVHLTVEDTGVGMDPETASRAFEPHFTTKRDAGAGLGLATVLATITQLGGHVHLTTSPGTGTRFDIYLPITTGPNPARSITANVRPARNRLSGRLLVLEEEPSVASFLTRALQHGGYVLDCARTPEELFAAVDQHGEPDLLVADVMLHTGAGLETVRRLRDRFPKLCVLLMSGVADDTLLAESKHILVEHIAKPFTTDELLARVDAIVGNPPG